MQPSSLPSWLEPAYRFALPVARATGLAPESLIAGGLAGSVFALLLGAGLLALRLQRPTAAPPQFRPEPQPKVPPRPKPTAPPRPKPRVPSRSEPNSAQPRKPSRRPRSCAWRWDRWRPGTRLGRWVCGSCGVEAFTMTGRPPTECKRASRPGSL